MQLTGICKTCLGCNRLLNELFKGIYRCPNYMKGKDENEKNCACTGSGIFVQSERILRSDPECVLYHLSGLAADKGDHAGLEGCPYRSADPCRNRLPS